jgi:hypothetical protein
MDEFVLIQHTKQPLMTLFIRNRDYFHCYPMYWGQIEFKIPDIFLVSVKTTCEKEREKTKQKQNESREA